LSFHRSWLIDFDSPVSDMGNFSERTFWIRTANPADSEAVTALLAASYSTLLSAAYESDLLGRGLPHFTKANPTLLSCGTYYVAERETGDLVGCGGWTAAEPGTGDVTEREAHIRHFATHPDWTRQGIGSALLAHCITYARSFGIRNLNCFSSLNAESFYRAAGFETVRPMDLQLAPSLALPALLMRLQIA
jgi:GNAT superfamily N-acetyltransferase